METLERYEHDYRIAKEKGARPELLEKMEQQIAKLKDRESTENQHNEGFTPEEIFFPTQEEVGQGESELDDLEDLFSDQSLANDDLPPF